MGMRVVGVWRYPVKSMLGESLSECTLGPNGFEGDRAFALIDADDGKVASAKNPRKWGGLLTCRAALVGRGVVEITLPDGATVTSDDPEVDAVLTKALGRPVRLASKAPDDRSFEEVWPAIDGLAPAEVISGTAIGTTEEGESISQLPLGSAAPAGTFFDLAVLHVLTTGTLARLQQLVPDSVVDVRRYRPNLLIETDGAPGFVENEWVGQTLSFGASATSKVSLAAMRCVMTTLAQEDLPRDRAPLQALATHNRVEIPGFGTWACAGAYADAGAPGTVRVGDPVEIS